MSTSGGGGGVSNAPSRSNVSVTSINCTNSNSTTNAAAPSTSTIGPDGVVNASVVAQHQLQDNGTTTTTSGDINGQQQQQQQTTLNNGNHFYGNGSIRISVPKMDESDESETELSHIENTATVNMRKANFNKNGPRPMSWEGELSENDDQMEAEISSVINENTSSQPSSVVAQNLVKQTSTDSENVPLISQDAIKPEYGEYMVSEPNTGPTFTNNSTKRFPVDISNLKYEPGVMQETGTVNSPLLARSKTTLLPANPSPDSAIHSVYTHSSPSQSPLTSRHAPYTPSLSRNNSDASYSSCYSYSSEFSPTHSPIQGRHNMYNNFNGSPLHHSVLYKPMVDGDNIKMQSQSQSHEDTLLEAEAIPSAGISRQQLINR